MASSSTVDMSHYGARHNLRHNWRLMLSCKLYSSSTIVHGLTDTGMLLSTCYFTFGYDSYIYSGVIAMPAFIEKFGSPTPAGYILTARETSIVSSIPTIGALLGFVMIALLADRYGRKITIYIACVVGLVGMALQVAGVSLALVTVGRTIAGKEIHTTFFGVQPRQSTQSTN